MRTDRGGVAKRGLNSAFPKHGGNVGDGVGVQAGVCWVLSRLFEALPSPDSLDVGFSARNPQP